MGDRSAFIIRWDPKNKDMIDKIKESWEGFEPSFINEDLVDVGILIGWDKGSYPDYVDIVFGLGLPRGCTMVTVRDFNGSVSLHDVNDSDILRW